MAHDGLVNWNDDDMSHTRSWRDGLGKVVIMMMTYTYIHGQY